MFAVVDPSLARLHHVHEDTDHGSQITDHRSCALANELQSLRRACKRRSHHVSVLLLPVPTVLANGPDGHEWRA